MNGIRFVELADCPPGRAYFLGNPTDARSFLQYPELACALAKGERVVVIGPDLQERRQQIEAAIRRVGRIDGVSSTETQSH